MELRELRSFCTAARFRSMTKAAQHLNLGQPTVTTHIKKLEVELGTVLFDRVRRPIQLTASGKALADLATPLVEGIDSLAAMTSQAEEQQPVHVASTPDIITHTLLRVVSVFIGRFPDVHFHIRSRTRAEVLRVVAEGEADIGIIEHPERDEAFEFQGLFVYERVLITPLKHPLLEEPLSSLDQIAAWPLILMESGTYTREILEEQFKRRGVAYDVAMTLDSMDMIKRYVALGLGVSVGPRLAIEEVDQLNLGVVSLANFLPVDQAGIVTLRGRRQSTPTENFIAVMRDTLAPAGSRG